MTIAEVIHRREPVFVRSLSHLTALVARRPFAAFDAVDVHERCVTFLPVGQAWTQPLPFSGNRNAEVQLQPAVMLELWRCTATPRR